MNIFNLLKPITDYIDSGRFFRQPFQWLYYFIGAVSALTPLYVLYILIESRIFKYAHGGDIFAIILIWVVFSACCVCGLFLWLRRGKQLKELLPENSKFIALPCICNFVQTSGEFFGLFIGIFGFVGGLLSNLFGIGQDFPLIASTIPACVFSLIMGYVVVVFSRYISELILAIASIANNTEKIANK